MSAFALEFNPELPYQSMNVVLPIGKESRRVETTIRYLDATDRWYMTMKDSQTNEDIFTNIPLIASYGARGNNLLDPFGYKNIGVLGCIPKTDHPSTVDPSKDSLGEFYIVWGYLDGE